MTDLNTCYCHPPHACGHADTQACCKVIRPVGHDETLEESTKDARLIALVPDMAEAILTTNDQHREKERREQSGSDCRCAACSLAPKLRAIGGQRV